MSLPIWLLSAVAWSVAVLGYIVTVALAALLAWLLCETAYRRGRFAWEFTKP